MRFSLRPSTRPKREPGETEAGTECRTANSHLHSTPAPRDLRSRSDAAAADLLARRSLSPSGQLFPFVEGNESQRRHHPGIRQVLQRLMLLARQNDRLAHFVK